MRELVLTEQYGISGGSAYSSWDVIWLSGFSSGIAFGIIGGIAAQSLIEGIKCMVACTVPTAVVSTVLVGSMAFFLD